MIYREGKGLRMTAGMNRDARVYVAGHQGLVGGAIWRRLEKAGFTNPIGRTSKELDLREQAAVQRFFAEEKPDYVFLAAARVGGIRANNTYPAEFICDNLMIQTNVLHQSYVHGVQKLLFLGSSCIYPKLCPQPMKRRSFPERQAGAHQRTLRDGQDRWGHHVPGLPEAVRRPFL